MQLRAPRLTLTLALVAIIVHTLPTAGEWLQFKRTGLAGAEVWRWFTGHLTHFDANHLAWDVGALLALGFAAERESARRTGWTLLISSGAISAAVWFFQPQFEVYRGLSGVDSALFGLLAGNLLCRGRTLCMCVGTAALLAVTGKLIFEIVSGTAVFASAATYTPVPLAHVVGLVCGVVVALVAGLPGARASGPPSNADETPALAALRS